MVGNRIFRSPTATITQCISMVLSSSGISLVFTLSKRRRSSIGRIIVLICYHPQNPIRMKVQLATTGVRNRLSPLSYSPQTTRVYVRVLVTVICSVLVSYTVGIERHVVSQ